MPDVTRNWLFNISVETANAQARVDKLILSLKELAAQAQAVSKLNIGSLGGGLPAGMAFTQGPRGGVSATINGNPATAQAALSAMFLSFTGAAAAAASVEKDAKTIAEDLGSLAATRARFSLSRRVWDASEANPDLIGDREASGRLVQLMDSAAARRAAQAQMLRFSGVRMLSAPGALTQFDPSSPYYSPYQATADTIAAGQRMVAVGQPYSGQRGWQAAGLGGSVPYQSPNFATMPVSRALTAASPSGWTASGFGTTTSAPPFTGGTPAGGWAMSGGGSVLGGFGGMGIGRGGGSGGGGGVGAGTGGYNMFSHMFYAMALYKSIETVVGVYTKLIEAEKQAENSSARIAFVMETNRTSAQGLNHDLTALAASFGVAATKMDEGAVRITQTTKDTTEQLLLMKEAAALTMISGENLATSVDDITRVQRSFNLAITDTPRIMNVLATMYREVPNTMPENIDLLEKLGAVAETTGASMEELAILAARAGQRSGSGATQIANTFERAVGNLTDPKVQLKLFSQFGIDATKPGTSELRPLIELLKELESVHARLIAEGRQSEALDLVQSIIGKRPNAVRDFVSLLGEVNHAMPKIADSTKLAGEVMDTLTVKIDKAAAAWERFLQSSGATDFLKDTADQLTRGLNAMTMAAEGSEKWGGGGFREAVKRANMNGQLTDFMATQLEGKIPINRQFEGGAPPSQGEFTDWLRKQGLVSSPNPRAGEGLRPGLAGTPAAENVPGPVLTDYQNQMQKRIRANSAMVGLENPINDQAVSAKALADMMKQSVEYSATQLKLWQDQLEVLGFQKTEVDAIMEGMRGQVDSSVALVNVEGKLQLIFGAQAARLKEIMQSQSQGPGFKRIGLSESNYDQFKKLEEYFHNMLQNAGLKDEATQALIATGQDQVEAMHKSLWYEQSSNLALQEIEKLQQQQTNGVFNWPSDLGQPLVPLTAFDMDRRTRSLMDDKQLAGIKVTGEYPDVGKNQFPWATTFDTATDKFDGAVALFAAAVGNDPRLDAQDKRDLAKEQRDLKGYIDVYDEIYGGKNSNWTPPSSSAGGLNTSDVLNLQKELVTSIQSAPIALSATVNLNSTVTLQVDGAKLGEYAANSVLEGLGFSTPAKAGTGMF